jgi:hypothetical protein
MRIRYVALAIIAVLYWSRACENTPPVDSASYAIKFVNQTKPILIRCLKRIRFFETIERWATSNPSQQQVAEFYNRYETALREATGDLKFLRTFSDSRLGKHMKAKYLLGRVITLEIELWFAYEKLVVAKSRTKRKNRKETAIIERALSSNLLEFQLTCDSLKAFYMAGLGRLERQSHLSINTDGTN